MRTSWIVVVLFCFSGPVAASCDIWPRLDSFHVDQDLFAPGNEDRNYTMGLRFGWSDASATSHCFYRAMHPAHAWLDGVTGMPDGQGTVSFAIGNSAFTPDDLRAVAVIPDDRPYASLLYASSQHIVETIPGRAAEGSKLVVGILGLGLAEPVQTAIHVANRAIAGGETPYDPEGWHNQINDGGDPTFMVQRSWFGRLELPWRYVDAAHSLDASLGYYSGASYAVVAKVGGFDKENPAMPFWAMVTEIDPQSDTDQLRARIAADKALPAYTITEWYFLVGGRVRWVGYNQLLQGGGLFQSSAHELAGSELERVVEEWSAGLNLSFTRGRRLMFTCTQRGAEHQLAQARSHRWCGINYYRPIP